jgi:hypothetical protein
MNCIGRRASGSAAWVLLLSCANCGLAILREAGLATWYQNNIVTPGGGHRTNDSSAPAAMAVPMTPATFGPIACISR